MKPDAGLVLGGRYRLVSRIAVGGMGEVWVAHDDALRRDVAVKVLREEFAGDEGFLERFRTEARNGAQLSHPNIAALYDYGEQGGSGFLVMELVLGEPMSDLLDRQPVLPTRRLLPILAQTARALHAAHVASVVHRDVKPGNILLARSGRVKITDFGISTASNQVPMTASGMVMGTAQYLSPEQAMGRAATPASDIYSLGIVAYEGLVGHRPFTGATAVDIAIAHVNTAVPPLPSSVDPALADLVMRMLDKDPEKRPRSAASLARQLDDLVDGTPSEGVPIPVGRHARPVDVVDALDEGDIPTAERPAVPPVVAPARPVPHPGVPDELPDGPGPALPLDDRTAGSAATAAAAHSAPPAPSAHSAGPVDGSTPPVPSPPSASLPPSVPSVPSASSAPSAPSPPTASSADEPAPTSVPAGTPTSLPRTPASLPRTTATRAGRRRAAPDASPVEDGEDADEATTTRRAARTSTTTGVRWRGLTHPLVALVLMLLFALLGAAFADRLWGPSRAAEDGPGGSAGPDHVLVAGPSTAWAAVDGMIDRMFDHGHESGITTTAKDR